MKQNLPGGSSAVVPPDPMPNSEVKRRSADGSVGSPHVRVGNCQASNKQENLMRKHGVFLFVCSLSERDGSEQDKCVGNGFAPVSDMPDAITDMATQVHRALRAPSP